MKKFRQRILEIKEGFLDADDRKACEAFYIANAIFLVIIGIVICLASSIFVAFNLDYIFYSICIIVIVGVIIFQFIDKAFHLVLPYSARIFLRLFGRYGRVVTKQDWKRIKKACPKAYKELWSKESFGHCYYYSWGIALFLKDAELMYCSIKLDDGHDSAHSVIVKNNCVYDTNARIHYTLEAYKKMFDVSVYKMFNAQEYRTENFFDNIREDFVQWCAERNVYCDPQ